MLSSGARRHGRRAMLVSFLCGLAGLGAGCKSTVQETINQREYASYRGSGSATIEGQVTMTLPSGNVMNGSACQVRLTPITSASTSYIQGTVMTGGTKPWKADSDSVWWLEKADQEGRFRFREVPAGSYYLTCPVAWRDDSGGAKQRILWAEATAAPGETTTVAVSR